MADSGGSSDDDQRVQITLLIDREHIFRLKRSFPELPIQEVATAITRISLEEFVGLLAGEKRYLSLSHQYIEWLDAIYQKLLPKEEYTYQKISENFNFPPGQASYISRILRSRQHGERHILAIRSLLSKLSNAQKKVRQDREKANLEINSGVHFDIFIKMRERRICESILWMLTEKSVSQVNLKKDDRPEFQFTKLGDNSLLSITYRTSDLVVEELESMLASVE